MKEKVQLDQEFRMDSVGEFLQPLLGALDTQTMRLAMLFDGDNISCELAKTILKKAREFGSVSLQRVYGDFTVERNKKWKDVSNKNGIRLVQATQYVSRKNTTDIQLTIDAMNMLHSAQFDGFCIATSDSDFTILVLTLKEYNKKVYVFGNEKTHESLRNASTKFIDTNSINQESSKKKKIDRKILEEIFAKHNKEWIAASSVQQLISQRGINYKDFGYSKFNDFIKKETGYFKHKMSDNKMTMYVGLKKASS